MDMIQIKRISFAYGSELAIDNLDLSIGDGEIIALVGPSGSGKSTLLRLISGLETPTRGQIVTHYPVNGDNGVIRFLFQDYDAYPWYTAWENVKKSSSKSNNLSDSEVQNILVRVGLWASRNKYPMELSGGMRKRLALARCLVAKPALLLLDEPFAKLDFEIKYEMYSLLQQLWSEYRPTVVCVTHDLHEAILLGTRILVSTPLPFRINKIIGIPFAYPRDDSIMEASRYTEIMRELKTLMRGAQSMDF